MYLRPYGLHLSYLIKIIHSLPMAESYDIIELLVEILVYHLGKRKQNDE